MAQFTRALPRGTSFGFPWQQLCECAILELDNSKVPGRIAAARHAIFDRAEEILTNPSGDEHRALNHALRALRLIEDAADREKPAA